jgi:TPR repeat protein
MNQEAIGKANNIYDEGSMSELYEFIQPFLNKDDPYALYLYSLFSLEGWNESDEEYDKRYVDSLTKAAEGNVAEAMYRLSSLYFTGDSVDLNIDIGKSYLDRAMELNFGLAKLSVGINLYHGSNGYPKNIDKSVELVTDSFNDGVEGAEEVLKKIKASI